MEYSLSSLLDLVGAFLLGMFIMEKIIFNRIRKALEEAGVDFEAEDKPEVVKVNKYFIENINGLLYLYDFTTHNFIGQGNTLEEASKNYSLNYVGYIGHVKETPLNVPFFIIDGKIERIDEE